MAVRNLVVQKARGYFQMSIRLTTEQMAKIYISRAGRSAAYEVNNMLRNFKDSAETTRYWTAVLNVVFNHFAR